MSKCIYKTTGGHHNCYHEEFFYDELDFYLYENKLTLVEVSYYRDFEDFVDEEDEDVARELFNDFDFKQIHKPIEYGDWNALELLVGTNEANELRKVYFDCDDYKNTNCVALLYWEGYFVTLLREDGEKFENKFILSDDLKKIILNGTSQEIEDMIENHDYDCEDYTWEKIEENIENINTFEMGERWKNENPDKDKNPFSYVDKDLVDSSRKQLLNILPFILKK